MKIFYELYEAILEGEPDEENPADPINSPFDLSKSGQEPKQNQLSNINEAEDEDEGNEINIFALKEAMQL